MCGELKIYQLVKLKALPLLFSLLQKYRENRYCCHTRESGYPEVSDFKEYWIPDKDLGNDE